MTSDLRYSFRWGVPEIEDFGGVYIYGWMLRNYAAAGIKPIEFLAIVHVSAYHYESARGVARPSLATIARQMGFAHKNSVYRILAGMADPDREGGPLLVITHKPGLACEYNAAPLARRLLDLERERAESASKDDSSRRGASQPAPKRHRAEPEAAPEAAPEDTPAPTPAPTPNDTRMKGRGNAASAVSSTKAITDRYCKLLGYDPGDWSAGEAAAAKKIATDWTPDQVAEAYTYYKNEPFWSDKRLRLASLKNMIPEYFRAKAQGRLRKTAANGSARASIFELARQRREGVGNGNE